MPFKSLAQKRKMHELEAQGKLAKGTTKRWISETPKGKPLPERVSKSNPRSLQAVRDIAKKKFSK